MSLRSKHSRYIFVLFSFLVSLLGLAACSQAPSSFISFFSAQNQTAAVTETPTATATLVKPTATSTPLPTFTPTLTLTPTATTAPFDLNSFTPKLYNGVSAYAYIDEDCQVLSEKWGENKSSPNTVVVPIMYHSVRQAGKPVTDSITVSEEYFLYTMQYAHDLGFETITTDQLIGFLYHNEPIPERSMILIIDDRRPGVAREHFLPIMEKYDWETTLAYITGPAAEWEWVELEKLTQTGHFEVQAHGFMHSPTSYFTEYTEPDVIEEEVYGAIPLIESRLGVRPDVFIWPGGNFTPESIAVVHQAGYEIAFTAYSRGPILYNWIPLGNEEAAMNDPLMVLPRYWSTSATVNLDEAVAIQNKLVEFNQENQAEAYRWYNAFCPGWPALAEFEETQTNEP